MKKKISLLFLLIPLMCFPFIKICAADDDGYKRITFKQSTGIPININGVNNQSIHHGNFYYIELDDQVTLCLNANMPITLGAKYVKVRDINYNASWGNNFWVKAYIYAINNKNDIVARAAAQIVAWQRDQWPEIPFTDNPVSDNIIRRYESQQLIRALVQGLKRFNYKSPNVTLEAIKQFINISNTEIPDGITVSVWRDSEHEGHQDVIAFGDVIEKPVENIETCKLTKISRLSDCYGNYATYGYAYETTEGDCLPGFNKKKNNVYSQLGKKEADVGTYCRMYCTKFFKETLPGNYATAVNVGRYIVWPNNNINNNRYKVNANLSEYPMSLAIEKDCYLSPDRDKFIEDYNTVVKNYNNYINSIRTIYNRYRADGRVCTWFENDYNTKKNAADDYCNNQVGSEPSPSHYDVSYPCCVSYNSKGKCTDSGTCTSSVETSEHAAWRERVQHCNELRSIENEALNKLNQCNAIQNYVNAVANVIKDFNNCVTYNASFNMNFTAPGISASYDDNEYGMTMSLKESKTVKTCDGCSSGIAKITDITKFNVENNLISNGVINQKLDAIEGREIIGSTRKYYDLINGYYYYVNKDNNKATNSIVGVKNYSIIGFSNMPISYNADPKRNYNLKISIPSLTGTAQDFTSMVSSNNYVCHYKVTKTTSGSCICPEGTKHAGESLDCLSKNNNGTCLDNQEQYCNSDQEIPHNCTGDDLTCPNDPTMDLSSCVNAGKTYDWCANQFCNSGTPGNQRWVCPSGSNEGMDLSSCVIPMIVKGYSERDAYNYCKDVTCPYNGIKIIYRVIDLTNPFPSKDADSIVTQRDLRVGMFNDELKGRYPGANWNSTTVVKNKILNNRGKDGDKVYDKEPLYTFIVDTSNIKEIRKYNNAQRDSYSDFKLNCLDGRTACKSDFVHNSIYGLKGGTCKNVSKGNFYTCAS